jgi:hypothetical protein
MAGRAVSSPHGFQTARRFGRPLSHGTDKEFSEPLRPDVSTPAGSREDPAAFDTFAQSLLARMQARLASPLDLEVQVEFARLTRLLNNMPREAVLDHRRMFEVAYAMLGADRPNLFLVRSLIRDLIIVQERSVGGLARLLLPICGRSALNAVLTALLTLVAMSFAIVLVLGSGLRLVHFADGISEDDPLLSLLQGVAFIQVTLMMHAAFLGSVVSIVARMNYYLMASTMTPLMIYLSIITRPLIAGLFSVLVFSTLKSGLVSIYGLDLDRPNGVYVAWAIGFLCGFSERLASDFAIGASHTLGDPARAATFGRPGGS